MEVFNMSSKYGTFTSTATDSSFNLELGFVPAVFKLYDVTTQQIFIWMEGMASGYYILVGDDGALSYETSGGPAAYSTSYYGLTLGTGWTVTSGTYFYEAHSRDFYEDHGDVDAS